MEWGKLKTIIIIMLLLVNGFLLVLVGARRGETQRYERSALDQTVQVLAENGIQVDPENVTAADRLSPQSAERDNQAEERLAHALLGETVTGENRGGGLYTYTGSRGQVDFRSGGELYAQMEPDPRWQTEDPEEHAAGLVREMKLKTELTGSELSGGTGTVTFRQLWDGAPLFSSEITFLYREGQLEVVSGSLLAVEATAEEAGEVLSLPTALLRFLDDVVTSGDVCSAIVSMEPGYRAAQSFSGAVRLSPVWLIASNTADYYLDAVTGELTRLAGKP